MRKHALAIVLILLAPVAMSGNEERGQLVALLEQFLATSHTKAAHERFWSDDLVYTSSSGTRFGKADILEGFTADASAGQDEPTVVYSGEDVDVRIYGSTAVVAFRLVGTPADESAETAYYFNTGTFVNRGGEWRAVAWQATKIPPAAGD